MFLNYFKKKGDAISRVLSKSGFVPQLTVLDLNFGFIIYQLAAGNQSFTKFLFLFLKATVRFGH